MLLSDTYVVNVRAFYKCFHVCTWYYVLCKPWGIDIAMVTLNSSAHHSFYVDYICVMLMRWGTARKFMLSNKYQLIHVVHEDAMEHEVLCIRTQQVGQWNYSNTWPQLLVHFHKSTPVSVWPHALTPPHLTCIHYIPC